MVTLSGKIKGESVLGLFKYYEKNKKKLTKVDKKIIFRLAVIHHEDNKKFAKEIVDSKLCQLAILRLKQQNKCERIKISSSIEIVNPNAEDVIIAMNEILEESNKRGLNQALAFHCYGGEI